MGLAPDTPIPHVIHEIEKCGVIILALPLNLKRIDAFSAWIGDSRSKPVIAICAGKPGDRLRWNVAHELGHLVLHSDFRQLRKEQHQEADRFAAELLLPEEAMRSEIVQPVTLSSIAGLKPRWGVALQALIRRAYELKLITKRQYTYLFEQIAAKGWRIKEPANLDVAPEKPRAFMKMAELAFRIPVNFSKIAAETRLSTEIIQEILSGYDTAISLQQEQSHSAKVIPFSRNS